MPSLGSFLCLPAPPTAVRIASQRALPWNSQLYRLMLRTVVQFAPRAKALLYCHSCSSGHPCRPLLDQGGAQQQQIGGFLCPCRPRIPIEDDLAAQGLGVWASLRPKPERRPQQSRQRSPRSLRPHLKVPAQVQRPRLHRPKERGRHRRGGSITRRCEAASGPPPPTPASSTLAGASC